MCDLYFKHVASLSYNFSVTSIRLLKCFHKPKLVVKSIQNIINDGLLKKKKKAELFMSQKQTLVLMAMNVGKLKHSLIKAEETGKIRVNFLQQCMSI